MRRYVEKVSKKKHVRIRMKAGDLDLHSLGKLQVLKSIIEISKWPPGKCWTPPPRTLQT